MKRLVLCVFAVMLSVAWAAQQAQASLTIETLLSWDGYNRLSPFRANWLSRQVMGQTFTVTSPDTVLDTFTFFLDDSNRPVPFTVWVLEWGGGAPTDPASDPVGGILFDSGGQYTTNNHGAGGMETFTVDTLGLHLEAGKQYVACLATGLTDYGYDAEAWVGLAGNAFVLPPEFDFYSGGYLVTAQCGLYEDLLSVPWSHPWWRNVDVAGGDMAFSLVFSEPALPPNPVPEPTALIVWSLLGASGVGIGWWRRRRNAA